MFSNNLIIFFLIPLLKSQTTDWTKFVTGNKLQASDKQIVSTSGLKNYSNLIYCDMNNNFITNLSDIGFLLKLNKLYLNSNKISSLQNLENLTKLVILELSSNQIQSLKGLEKLTNFVRNYLHKVKVRL